MAGFSSCSQNENEGYNETAVLSVVSSAGNEVVGALLGNSKTVSLRAAAATVAGEPLTIISFSFSLPLTEDVKTSQQV